jgi:hypothetical protein
MKAFAQNHKLHKRLIKASLMKERERERERRGRVSFRDRQRVLVD